MFVRPVRASSKRLALALLLSTGLTDAAAAGGVSIGGHGVSVGVGNIGVNVGTGGGLGGATTGATLGGGGGLGAGLSAGGGGIGAGVSVGGSGASMATGGSALAGSRSGTAVPNGLAAGFASGDNFFSGGASDLRSNGTMSAVPSGREATAPAAARRFRLVAQDKRGTRAPVPLGRASRAGVQVTPTGFANRGAARPQLAAVNVGVLNTNSPTSAPGGGVAGLGVGVLNSNSPTGGGTAGGNTLGGVAVGVLNTDAPTPAAGGGLLGLAVGVLNDGGPGGGPPGQPLPGPGPVSPPGGLPGGDGTSANGGGGGGVSIGGFSTIVEGANYGDGHLRQCLAVLANDRRYARRIVRACQNYLRQALRSKIARS